MCFGSRDSGPRHVLSQNHDATGQKCDAGNRDRNAVMEARGRSEGPWRTGRARKNLGELHMGFPEKYGVEAEVIWMGANW